MSEVRKAKRDALFGKAGKFKSEIIELEGEEYEIKQPSVKVRSQILKKAGVKSTSEGKDQDVDLASLQVWAVIGCTFIPNTSENVFDEADVEALMNEPAGGFVDTFSEKALNLLNVEPEKQAKN